MTVIDYMIMLGSVVVVSVASLVVWDRYLSPRLVKKYEGAWAKDSGTPPWGWPISITLGTAAFGLLIFGPSMLLRVMT